MERCCTRLKCVTSHVFSGWMLLIRDTSLLPTVTLHGELRPNASVRSLLGRHLTVLSTLCWLRITPIDGRLAFPQPNKYLHSGNLQNVTGRARSFTLILAVCFFLAVDLYRRRAGFVYLSVKDTGFFRGRVIPVTQKLALQWLPCQAPGVIESALGLVGPVSVYCDWVR